jgi:hypothetical protein
VYAMEVVDLTFPEEDFFDFGALAHRTGSERRTGSPVLTPLTVSRELGRLAFITGGGDNLPRETSMAECQEE